MPRNFNYAIRNLTEEENLTNVYWFYNVCQDSSILHNVDEFEMLYDSLVSYFHLQDHSQKVLNALIRKYEKSGILTRKKNALSCPYDCQEDIGIVFNEDGIIYDRCGQWDTSTIEDINLVRGIFAPQTPNLSYIVACTFFCKEDKNRKTFTLPAVEPEVPEAFIAASKKTDKVQFMIDALKLSPKEGQLLSTAYLTHDVKEVYVCMNTLCSNDFETTQSIYAKCMGLSIKDIKMLLRRDKSLVSYDLMDSDGKLTKDATDCIFSGEMNTFFCDVLKELGTKESYPLDTFSVKTDESGLALRLLQNDSGANLLLYGAAGAGKTEYARALAVESGLTPYIFKNELEVEDDYSDPEKHALNRLNCLLSLKKENAVIIVDEAENLLSTKMNMFDLLMNGGSSNGRKGTVNTMLEHSVNRVIWILNYTKPLDESTLRRFTYSIRFKEMSKNMLRSIADAKLNKLDMSDELHSKLVELCGKYHVTGASVDNVVKTIQGMDLKGGKDELVVSDVQKVLEANSTLIFGKSKMRELVQKSYDLSVLNTSIPAADIVEMVMNAQSWAEENSSENGGVRMLFYGVSGTGKTELARYIAEKLNKKICLKRVSDIMSKYVGENEQNIAAAFAQAEESGDILLFDEADSFFSDRSSASRGWERTLVNEFLTQMEEFNGILICTTNLKEIMDPAMQRRFHIMTEFKPLKKEGIRKLLGRFFKSYSFTSDDVASLYRYDTVTPGDFGTLSGKLRFMARGKVTPDWIIGELCHIQDEKRENGGRIGFAG